MEKVFHPADSRGKANFGWLNANYSFSFANYYNPDRIQFGLLRVLNDDVVSGGMGFGTHPHKDMEIITIPLKGALTHRDSMKHSATIQSGEVQVMSAGTGVEHSEFNASNDKEVNLLQLWIFPEKKGVEPRYEQKNFSEILKPNELLNIVSPKDQNRNGALWINQQAHLHLGDFEAGNSFEYRFKNPKNGVYAFLIEGEAKIEDQPLKERDALGLWNTDSFKAEFSKASKILLIEVPMN